MWSLPKKLWGDRESHHQRKSSVLLLGRHPRDARANLGFSWHSEWFQYTARLRTIKLDGHAQMKLDHSGLSVEDPAKRGAVRNLRRMKQCGLNRVGSSQSTRGNMCCRATFPRWTSQEKELEREKQNPKMFGIRVTVQGRHTHILFTSRRRTVDVSEGSYFSNVCRLDWVEKKYKLI